MRRGGCGHDAGEHGIGRAHGPVPARRFARFTRAGQRARDREAPVTASPSGEGAGYRPVAAARSSVRDGGRACSLPAASGGPAHPGDVLDLRRGCRGDPRVDRVAVFGGPPPERGTGPRFRPPHAPLDADAGPGGAAGVVGVFRQPRPGVGASDRRAAATRGGGRKPFQPDQEGSLLPGAGSGAGGLQRQPLPLVHRALVLPAVRHDRTGVRGQGVHPLAAGRALPAHLQPVGAGVVGRGGDPDRHRPERTSRWESRSPRASSSRPRCSW